MEVRFSDPEFLRLFIVIPIIIAFHFFSINYKKRRAVSFANFEAIERVTGTELISKNIVLLVLNLIITSTLIFSAAGMTIWYTEPVSTYNYVIGIDSSNSMTTDDFSPDRLTVAKTTAIDFVSFLPRTTNVGVISFSGSGFIEQMPTTDLSKAISAIEGISVKSIGGTDISEAVITGTNILSVLEDTRTKSVIILTDGQINAGPELKEVIDYAKNHRVVVNAIGLGTLEGGTFSSGGFSKIDQSTLKSLAYNTGGSFFLANDSQAIRDAYLEIIEPTPRNIPHNISGLLVIFTVFLFVVNWWLANMRYEGLP
mgnify:CR=1 FL=1